MLLWLWSRLAAAAHIWPQILTPDLGISICHRCGPKKKKKKIAWRLMCDTRHVPYITMCVAKSFHVDFIDLNVTCCMNQLCLVTSSSQISDTYNCKGWFLLPSYMQATGCFLGEISFWFFPCGGFRVPKKSLQGGSMSSLWRYPVQWSFSSQHPSLLTVYSACPTTPSLWRLSFVNSLIMETHFKTDRESCIFSFPFFFFFVFLRLHPWHMEVPRLGVESEP